MKLFDVYPLYNINIVKGKGCKVWDENGTEYLDLYGGHAVISIGHAHPHYVEMISNQVANLGFYSNSVINKLQQQVAERLGKISGYEDYSLFLINSGAEANENALKLASFHNGRTKVVSFSKAFHGRTSLAVEATNNPSIIAPINNNGHVVYLPLNDVEAMKQELSRGDICAVIIEGIQGVGGIKIPTTEFMQELRKACTETGTILILDEIQSGYGRSGKFFAHQYADIKPDIITVAKGIGNGFPMAGVLISPMFKPVYGQLGTTFGGNHLACSAALAVMDVIEQENLVENAAKVGNYLLEELKKYDEAVGQYEKAVELDPTKTDLYKNISSAYEQKNDYKKAIGAYHKYYSSLEKEKQTPDLQFQLGRLYYGAGTQPDSLTINAEERKQALMSADSVFQVISEAAPDSYLGNFWRARANSALDPETTQGLAKPFYEEVAALLESKNDPHYNSALVECYSYLGYYYLLAIENPTLKAEAKANKEKSKEYWSKILAIDPANATAKRALDGIK